MPVDSFEPDMAGSHHQLLENGEHNQIVFLSLRGLLRARHDPEFMRCLRDAALVLPVSLPIVQGARFLGGRQPEPLQHLRAHHPHSQRYREDQGLGLPPGRAQGGAGGGGGEPAGSFHGIRVVGRFYGYFPKSVEGDIVTAIKKSSPSMVLVGSGVPGKDKWILRHRKDLNPGISLWAGNCFEVFAGREKQVSRKLHAAGLGVLSGIGRRPWRLGVDVPLPVLPRAAAGVQDLQAVGA